MADTIIVGRTIGINALAAVGATGSISFLIIGFVQGITGGFAIITAQKFGAGAEDGVRRSVATSIVLSVGVTIVVTLISVFGARHLLELMNTPKDIIDDAYNYIVVIFEGIVAAVFFNLFSGILRSLGDSKIPLIFLIVACVINIVLDFAFILIFKMGVAGAGWATVIAQLISAVLCLFYSLRKYPILRLKASDWKFSWYFAWRHLAIGLPMAFQFSITAIGIMIVQTALNSLGSTAVAAFTAGSKIDQLAIQPLQSLGLATATFIAQNYGAKKFKRTKDGVKCSTVICLVCGFVGSFLVIAFSKPLVGLFVGSDQQEVIGLSREYLIINGAFYFILGLLFVYRNALQGIGCGMIAFIGGVLELLMRSAIAFSLVSYLGFTALCVASPCAWFIAAVWFIAAYVLVMKKMLKNKENSFE